MARYFKHKYFLIFLSAIVLVGAAILFVDQHSYLSPGSSNQNISTPYVQIDELKIPVEIATSTPAIQKGLSGRTSLDPNDGMIFIFSKPDKYRFWMPDMHFPLDIIWIDNGEIVGITKNASNEFDPANPVFYTPPEPAQYVLEVNAGFSEDNDINIGDGVVLNNLGSSQ